MLPAALALSLYTQYAVLACAHVTCVITAMVDPAGALAHATIDTIYHIMYGWGRAVIRLPDGYLRNLNIPSKCGTDG